mmetsp:Transcript_675/g.1130  ORF Transcript_675/g.1130 Transcript_675/m.1130 type:complete len:530 (+) Transcript_675:47-1636(+)
MECCFAFLRPQTSRRGSCCCPSVAEARVSTIEDKQLPSLEAACCSVNGSCSLALVRRRCYALSQLGPVTLRILADNLRSGGPRNALQNTSRLRVALESLGPAFVKLGQAAASREDILSDAIAAELRKLCDQVPPFPHEEAARLVVAQLGKMPDRQFESCCVAAASLGQVYQIKVDGKDYAMKVQRPGLVTQIAMDVLILKGMAKALRFLVRHFMAAGLDPVQVVDDWAQTLWNELDYNMEGRCMEQMRNALCGDIHGLVIPRVRWSHTSLKVLTTEWVHGYKPTEDPKRVQSTHISIGVETFAAMILNVGVVHADPHPGNMILTHDNEVCLLDFGMVCHVPLEHRRAWAQCIVNLVRRDHNAVLDDLITIGFFPEDCPREDVLPVMSQIWTQLVECGSDIHKRKKAVQMLYAEILTLVRRFKFALPDYYVALVRALVTLEGIALAADCNFDIFEAAFPCALRFLSSTSDGRSVGSALLIEGLRSSCGFGKVFVKTACRQSLHRLQSNSTAIATSGVALLILAAAVSLNR